MLFRVLSCKIKHNEVGEIFTGFIWLLFILLLSGGCNRSTHKPIILREINKDVTIFDSAQTYYSTNTVTGYYFVDMYGNLLYKRPATLCVSIDENFFAGISDSARFSMYKNDSIIWTLPIKIHHEIFLNHDSNIVTLGYEYLNFRGKKNHSFDVLYTISRSGQILKTQRFYSLVDPLEKLLPYSRDSLIRKNKRFFDKWIPDRSIIFDTAYFHINAIQELPENILGIQDKRFRKGNYLISSFINNFMAIIDPDSFDVLWFYFQEDSYMGQHSPRLLPNGKILYLVNNVVSKNDSAYTAVRILNPFTNHIEWEYSGNPPKTLHSITQGHNQLLPNGNILITINNDALVDEDAYVIEVTPDGQIVWKWVPSNLKELTSTREGFYRVERLIH